MQPQSKAQFQPEEPEPELDRNAYAGDNYGEKVQNDDDVQGRKQEQYASDDGAVQVTDAHGGDVAAVGSEKQPRSEPQSQPEQQQAELERDDEDGNNDGKQGQAPDEADSKSNDQLDARVVRTALEPSEVAFAITSAGSADQVSLIQSLWAPYIEKGYRVRVYGGNQTMHVPGIDVMNFMQLPMNEFPPLSLNFNIWDAMINDSQSSWYVRCDVDAFVNAPLIMQMLSNIDPTEAWYTGISGKGQKAGISFAYAQGEGCELISKGAARRVHSKLFDCLAWSKANVKPPIHSDVEFGRCLRTVGIGFSNIPVADYSVMISNKTQMTDQSVGLTLSDVKYVVNRSHAVIHPIKDHRVMMLLRDIELRGLTPLLGQQEAPPTSCLHNPQYVLKQVNGELPECQSRYRANLTGSEGAFLSLDPAKAQRGADAMTQIFKDEDVAFKGLQGTFGEQRYYFPVPNLTSGEMGYRQVFRKLFRESDPSKKGLRFAFEDDVMMHQNFTRLWKDIMSSERCMGFLSEPGGVLLLGASQWGSWATIDSQKEETCYNAAQLTLGSFAFIYSHHIIDAALDWLDNSNKPFDWLWGYLVQRGFPVRVARPNLVIAQTKKKSTVSASRKYPPDHLKRMRWEADAYTPVI
jgi:hypothetical protein